VARRDTKEKMQWSIDGAVDAIENLLEEIQQNLFQRALDFRTENTREANSWDEFVVLLKEKGGFISAHWDGTPETEQKIKLQYESSKSDYEFSIEEYATSKSNLNLAERIEKKQQIKFKEGLSSSFDFSEAQRQLYTAQQNYLQSMVNVINKKAALEKIINKN
jgi:hypothetical protein